MLSQAPLVDSSRLIPPFLRKAYRPLGKIAESLLALDAMNELYFQCRGASPEEFSERALRWIGFEWALPERELSEIGKKPGPILVLANHPRGGPEAVLLFLLLSKMRAEYRVMANYVLGRIPEIRPRLMMVDPFGGSSAPARNLGPLRETMRYLKGGGLLGAFPAGEVSSWRLDEGRVADPPWQEQIGRLALASGASVLPVYFEGSNSLAFHLAGIVHPRLRTLLLPRSVMRPADKKISLRLGSLIIPAGLKSMASPEKLSSALRRRVYALSKI